MTAKNSCKEPRPLIAEFFNSINPLLNFNLGHCLGGTRQPGKKKVNEMPKPVGR